MTAQPDAGMPDLPARRPARAPRPHRTPDLPGPDPARAPGPARRPRRARSVTESLLSVVLTLEAILVFFVTLTAFGLKALPPAEAFVGGAALLLALVLAAGILRFAWGIWFGWLLQAALVATGIFVPLMYFIGAIFGAIWVYCFVKGRQLDRAKAAAAASALAEPTTPSTSSPTTQENP